MEREVGQLVAQGAGELVLVGAEDDGAGTGEGHGGAPARNAATGEGVEQAAVRNYDEPEGTRRPQAEPGPARRAVGHPRQIGGHAVLGRPEHGGDPADLARDRLDLQQQGER
jgi:hypothetical protein